MTREEMLAKADKLAAAAERVAPTAESLAILAQYWLARSALVPERVVSAPWRHPTGVPE